MNKVFVNTIIQQQKYLTTPVVAILQNGPNLNIYISMSISKLLIHPKSKYFI